MASKFSEFITKNKIDPRRIVATSKRLEALKGEDRLIKLKKKQGAQTPAAGSEDDQAAKPLPKPRSGRPVTRPLFDRAVAGKPISGPAKTRLLRAINHLLNQKKKSATDLKALF